MLRIIAIFALLTLVSGAFAFGWIGGDDGNEFATLLFWICGVILAGLVLRAMLRQRPAGG
jgi:Flp pilus assembly protein protease CpaA